jgi:hypothetical protein
MQAKDIAMGAPAWVYILLIALVVLGVRRLKTRELPVMVALVPTVAFLIWSVVGAHAFAVTAGYAVALAAWLAGAAIGAITGLAMPEPRGERLPGRRVLQPGSVLPLILYLGVFVVRFACGAWAAIVPAQAITATAIGIAIGAAVMARLLIGVVRWKPTPSYSLAV